MGGILDAFQPEWSTPQQFVGWFDQKLAESRRREFRRSALLHEREGGWKLFYEELFPLYRLLQKKLLDWSDVEFKPLPGNQPGVDVEVKSRRSPFFRYIEITQADMDQEERWRTEAFSEHGSVTLGTPVSKENGRISVGNDPVDCADLRQEKVRLIRIAIKRKIKRFSRSRSDDIALLIYFDDCLYPFEDADGDKEVDALLDSVSNIWSSYTRLFLVGAREGYWERQAPA